MDHVEIKYVLLPVLYRCDIAESRDILAKQYVIAVQRQCVRCMVIENDIAICQVASGRFLRSTKIVNRNILQTLRNNEKCSKRYG